MIKNNNIIGILQYNEKHKIWKRMAIYDHGNGEQEKTKYWILQSRKSEAITGLLCTNIEHSARTYQNGKKLNTILFKPTYLTNSLLTYLLMKQNHLTLYFLKLLYLFWHTILLLYFYYTILLYYTFSILSTIFCTVWHLFDDNNH